MRRHHIVVALAALIAVSPLLLFGTSCGHDIGFHMQSWVDAAAQFRHGTFYPRWAFTPAWQAGEPRFVFYPPLAWMFGALLTLLLPMPATPNVFIFCVMLAAGFSMHSVARRFTSADGALIAACVYLANPYMFFNAFERSAYAELLASVWIPLLFLAVLRKRPSTAISAVAIALAWLTNVPTGIMATYTFVALAGTRLLLDWRAAQKPHHTWPRPTEAAASAAASGVSSAVDRHLTKSADELHRRSPPPQASAMTLASGLALGLALPAFYLFPAAVEKHFVQSSMVMIENLRYQDNYLFHRTSWEPHNVVTHTVSMLAVFMLAVTACVLLFLVTGRRRLSSTGRPGQECVGLIALFCLILFLLLPVSGFLWHIAPELPFLQFPWRLLTILSAVLALAVALALRCVSLRFWAAACAGLLYAAAAAGVTSHLYRQGCEIPHMAQYTLDCFRAGHGVPATDEYTPGDADNDVLRTDNPGYWLTPIDDPSAYAPGTIPNPNETDTNFDGPIPFQFTKADHAPSSLEVNLTAPAVLVLNLRDFPDWRIRRNGATVLQHVHRDDGLTAIALPTGRSHVDVTWHRGWDVYAGDGLSLAALLGLAFAAKRRHGSAHVESTVPVA